MDTIYIYALIDPISDEIRYIGKTKNIEKRYKQHLYPKKRDNSKRAIWLKELKINGLKPKIKVIDIADESLWSDMEKLYIAEYSSDELLNSTKGGQDGSHSTETIEKIKKGVSLAHKGRVLSKTHKNNISIALGKKVMIDGIKYDSCSEAGRYLNVNNSTIWRRCNSDNYTNYQFI